MRRMRGHRAAAQGAPAAAGVVGASSEPANLNRIEQPAQHRRARFADAKAVGALMCFVDKSGLWIGEQARFFKDFGSDSRSDSKAGLNLLVNSVAGSMEAPQKTRCQSSRSYLTCDCNHLRTGGADSSAFHLTFCREWAEPFTSP